MEMIINARHFSRWKRIEQSFALYAHAWATLTAHFPLDGLGFLTVTCQVKQYGSDRVTETESMKKTQNEQLHLTGRFTDAIDYARHLHIERRKGTDIPYMAHLLGVAALVMAEAGHATIPVTEDMVIAALLHDTVEDHGGLPRLEDVEQNFGSNVARMVKGLTDSFSENSGDKEPWQARKEAYIRRLKKEPADTQLISVADKLHNARAILEDYRDQRIGPKIWERFKRGRKEQLWYFNSLLEVFKEAGGGRTVEEFGRVVAELTQIS
jgi:(p)ppGpp synthase/HD superfamily hydrolase